MRERAWLSIFIVIAGLFVLLAVQLGNGVQDFYDDGTHVAQRSGIDIVEGIGIDATVTDDAVNSRVTLTIALPTCSPGEVLLATTGADRWECGTN